MSRIWQWVGVAGKKQKLLSFRQENWAALVGLSLAVWATMLIGGSALAAPPADMPVITAKIRVQDVPNYLNGLGTMQPLDVVRSKSR